jgi:hypothetical protein
MLRRIMILPLEAFNSQSLEELEESEIRSTKSEIRNKSE